MYCAILREICANPFQVSVHPSFQASLVTLQSGIKSFLEVRPLYFQCRIKLGLDFSLVSF